MADRTNLADGNGQTDATFLELAYRENFDNLTRRLRSRVYDEATARDLAQAAFLKLARHCPLPTLDDARALVYRIGKELAIDHVRNESRRAKIRDQHHEHFAITHPSPTPEQELIGRDELRRLETIVDRLPKKRRAALLLSRFEGKSVPEIAEKLSITEASVRRHIYDALRACRSAMKNDAAPHEFEEGD